MSDNTESKPSTTADAASSKSGGAVPSLVGGLVIGGALAAMGGLFVYLLLAFGYTKAVDTHSWKETDCTILKSAVKTERATPHSPGLSHELEIAYRYEFEGKVFESTRYRRIATRSSHLSKMKDIVERYPVRSRAVCFVDPDKPEDAVLKRDTKSVGYTVWFPGLFVIGGIGIMIASVRKFLRRRSVA